MLSGVRVIDMHAHFPVAGPRLAAPVDYVERFGEEKAQILAERKAQVQKRWRKCMGFLNQKRSSVHQKNLRKSGLKKWIAGV